MRLSTELHEENFSRGFLSGDSRRFTCILMPERGRRVIRCCGAISCPSISSKRNARKRLARMMIASCNENGMPMQTRGPAPKGM